MKSANSLSHILEKRLIFISGKGGVGKTALSDMLAKHAALNKKKTLLVELNSTGKIATVFDCEGHAKREIPLAPYISSINLNPKTCFEEYVIKHIKFKALYKTLFNNKFVGNFIKAVPGLNEILMLGKIYDLEKETSSKVASELKYDLIIVDAPATGHGLSTLEVPNIIKSAIKVGPLHKHAIEIGGLLNDEDKTLFCLVTLAEEMPVTESIDYMKVLAEKKLIPTGPIFINAVMPTVEKIKKPAKMNDPHLFWEYYNLAKERAALNQYYIDVIQENFKKNALSIIPYDFNGLSTLNDYDKLLENIKDIS